MAGGDLEAFKAEAARKRTAYERSRRVTSDAVLAFYREKFGQGHVK